MTGVTNNTSELAQGVSRPPEMSVGVASSLLGNIEQRLLSLKRKAEESLEEELECTRLCKARIDHLKSYVSGKDRHMCVRQTPSNHNSWNMATCF